MRTSLRQLFCLVGLAGLAACGQSGDLYLPDREPAPATAEPTVSPAAPAATEPAPADEDDEASARPADAPRETVRENPAFPPASASPSPSDE